MTSKELLYVTTIAQEASISRAAQKLYMTQPALSHCLSGIERELGQPLFRRGSRGLTLTYAGERYCRTAREILKMYGDMEQELDEMGELRRGRVNAGMTRFLATGILPGILPEFKRSYPGIEFILHEEVSAQLFRLLLEQQLDFAVMNLSSEELEEPDSAFQYHALGSDPFVIAAPEGDPVARLARPDPRGGLPVLDPVHLAGKPFILVSPGQRIRRVTDRVLAQAGVTPEVALTSTSFETARRVACAGLGVTLIPRGYASLFSDGRGASYFAIPEEYRAALTVAEVRLRGSYLPLAARRFLELLDQRYQAPEAP